MTAPRTDAQPAGPFIFGPARDAVGHTSGRRFVPYAQDPPTVLPEPVTV